MGPQEGEKASGGESEAPPQPVAPEGLAEPRPASGAEAGGSVEATQAETIVAAPAPSAGETGVRPTAPGVSGGPQGVLSSQKKAAPRARCVWVFYFLFGFFVFLFLLTCVIFSARSKRRRQWRCPP